MYTVSCHFHQKPVSGVTPHGWEEAATWAERAHVWQVQGARGERVVCGAQPHAHRCAHQMLRFHMAAQRGWLCAGGVGDSVAGQAWGLGSLDLRGPLSLVIWRQWWWLGDSFWFSAAISPARI